MFSIHQSPSPSAQFFLETEKTAVCKDDILNALRKNKSLTVKRRHGSFLPSDFRAIFRQILQGTLFAIFSGRKFLT